LATASVVARGPALGETVEGVRVFGWGIPRASSMVVDGTHLFLAASASITEPLAPTHRETSRRVRHAVEPGGYQARPTGEVESGSGLQTY
jgi:hypothetical protein